MLIAEYGHDDSLPIKIPSEKDFKRLQELFNSMEKEFLEKTKVAQEMPQPVYDEAYFRFLESLEEPYEYKIVFFCRKESDKNSNTVQVAVNMDNDNCQLVPWVKWELEATEIMPLVDSLSGKVFLYDKQDISSVQMEVKGTTYSVQPTDTENAFEVKGLNIANLEFALENQHNVWLEIPRSLWHELD